MTTLEHRTGGLHLALALGAALAGGCGGKATGPSQITHIDGKGESTESGGTLGVGGTQGIGGTLGVGSTQGVGGSSSQTCDAGSFLRELPAPASGWGCEPCPDSTWDHDANPETECVSWSQCVPGQHVESTGSTTLDRACAACPEGSFSRELNATECVPWSACLDGFVETAPGTPTSDRVCKEDPWFSEFGTTGTDFVYAVAADTEGNVFVAGSTNGTFPANESKGGIEDAFVRKYDAAGNELWTRQFGTTEWDVAQGLAVDTQGNVIVAGYTKGALLGSKTGDRDGFVRKYDTFGQELWTRQFGTETNDEASDVAVGANDEIVVVGFTVGSFVGPEIGSGDVFARKYDSLGNELWSRQFGSSALDQAAGVSVDDDGNVLIVGTTLGALPGYENAGQQDAFVCKYDGAGNELWTRQFGTKYIEYGSGVSTDAAGNVIVTGTTSDALPGQVDAGSYDAFARKYDASGAELWTRQFGTKNADYGSGVVVNDDGDVFVAGSTDGAFPGQVKGDGESDMYVRKYDGAGSELWTQQVGSSGSISGPAVCTDGNGHILLAGSTFTSSAEYDGFVVRLNQ